MNENNYKTAESSVNRNVSCGLEEGGRPQGNLWLSYHDWHRDPLPDRLSSNRKYLSTHGSTRPEPELLKLALMGPRTQLETCVQAPGRALWEMFHGCFL